MLTLNAVYLQLAKIRHQFGADDVLLGCPSVFFQLRLHIFGITLNEALESHIQIVNELAELLVLPSLCLTFG